MVGYITVNKNELKIKELNVYQAFYCGVCRDIKSQYGQAARLTLSYEMTFLAMLLSSVYDDRPKTERLKCLMHPASKGLSVSNRFTNYAADMCLVVSYHNLLDNWSDESDVKSLAFARALKKGCTRAAEKYPRQSAAVIKCVRDTRRSEALKSTDIDLISGHTGRMVSELFKYYDDDILNADLGRMGFFLGKFIYLMDAYDDIEKDEKNGSYNPFISMSKEYGFEDKAKELLTMMASEASMAFERLPAIDYVDILRNVLYSGMWTKYTIRKKARVKNK